MQASGTEGAMHELSEASALGLGQVRAHSTLSAAFCLYVVSVGKENPGEAREVGSRPCGSAFPES